VTVRIGETTPDGNEEVLTDYMCDWPDCPNTDVRLIGSIAALRAVVVCEEQALAPARPERPVGQPPVAGGSSGW